MQGLTNDDPMGSSFGTPRGNMPKILALIPAYNEARHLAGVVSAALAYLPVLVVDDGSTDDSAARAEAAGAQVLRQTPNQGKGAALRAGFRHAIDGGYAAVVMLDADGQHDPAEIPTFLDAYDRSQADLIIGARDYSRIPLIRRTSNTIGRWSFSWAVGQYIPDNQSGYRLLSRRLMQDTLASREDRFQFEVEMITTCIVQGYRLEWVPIRTIYADEKSHIRPLHQIYHFFRMVYETRRTMRSAGSGVARPYNLK
jgi:glycosyltransferase involved in cell wall biosynthesis